jgi:hypothetical protein
MTTYNTFIMKQVEIILLDIFFLWEAKIWIVLEELLNSKTLKKHV